MPSTLDISVFVYNNWNNTKILLDDLLKYEKYLNYNITVIDNGSNDETVNELPKYEENRIKIIYTENLSFAACHNLVMSKTYANYVCLLENTVQIGENCFGQLIEYAEKNPKAGIIVPKKSIEGRFLIGGKLTETGSCINLYEEDNEKEIEFLHPMCMLINTKTIRAIEVFDERFKVKYYEDVDFCLRAVDAGFDLVCLKDVIVNFSDIEKLELKRNQEGNRQLFVEKHTDWLEKYKGKAIKNLRRRKIR